MQPCLEVALPSDLHTSQVHFTAGVLSIWELRSGLGLPRQLSSEVNRNISWHTTDTLLLKQQMLCSSPDAPVWLTCCLLSICILLQCSSLLSSQHLHHSWGSQPESLLLHPCSAAAAAHLHLQAGERPECHAEGQQHDTT